jgi:hypothetical protein
MVTRLSLGMFCVEGDCIDCSCLSAGSWAWEGNWLWFPNSRHPEPLQAWFLCDCGILGILVVVLGSRIYFLSVVCANPPPLQPMVAFPRYMDVFPHWYIELV